MRNPLSIEAFADWCEKQPADEEYNYLEAKQCAAAQYLQSIGVIHYDLLSTELPAGWDRAVKMGEWTFGALAKRLREAA